MLALSFLAVGSGNSALEGVAPTLPLETGVELSDVTPVLRLGFGGFQWHYA